MNNCDNNNTFGHTFINMDKLKTNTFKNNSN